MIYETTNEGAIIRNWMNFDMLNTNPTVESSLDDSINEWNKKPFKIHSWWKVGRGNITWTKCDKEPMMRPSYVGSGLSRLSQLKAWLYKEDMSHEPNVNKRPVIMIKSRFYI